MGGGHGHDEAILFACKAHVQLGESQRAVCEEEDYAFLYHLIVLCLTLKIVQFFFFLFKFFLFWFFDVFEMQMMFKSETFQFCPF